MTERVIRTVKRNQKHDPRQIKTLLQYLEHTKLELFGKFLSYLKSNTLVSDQKTVNTVPGFGVNKNLI